MRIAVIAAVVILVGVVGAGMPFVLAKGQAVPYLRGASHGIHGVTTPTPPPSRLPEHQQHNQSDPEPALSSVQIAPVTPASGGRPNQEASP